VVDEMQLLRDLSEMLEEYEKLKDKEPLMFFLTAVMTELEGHCTLQQMFEALQDVLTTKYVLDDLDKEYFAKMIKKMFELKKKDDKEP